MFKRVSLGLIAIFVVINICYLYVLNSRYKKDISQEYSLNVIPSDHDVKSLIEKYQNKQEINILVLTGGGMRGLVPLYVLAYLEEKTGKHAGELFDFMAGVSSGALIITALTTSSNGTKYKYSAKDLISKYHDDASDLFHSPLYHQIFTWFGMISSRFDSQYKRHYLQTKLGKVNISQLKGNILIPVYNIAQNQIEIIKNWKDGGRSYDYPVAELVNGATAITPFFDPQNLSTALCRQIFIDPSASLNNPIMPIVLEVVDLFPKKKLNVLFIDNGTIQSTEFSYHSIYHLGVLGNFQIFMNTSMISTKLENKMLEHYIAHDDLDIKFFDVSGTPRNPISSSDHSDYAFNRIREFSEGLVNNNKQLLDQFLIKSKNVSHN